MTRKDYVLLAAALKDAKPLPSPCPESCHGWRLASHAVCEALSRDNPQFDRDRFLRACGVLS